MECDTPGFELRDKSVIQQFDGYRKLEMSRKKNRRIFQTSTKTLQCWRGNCDVQILLYDSDPRQIDPEEIAAVTDYVISYACKGYERMSAEKNQNKLLVEW